MKTPLQVAHHVQSLRGKIGISWIANCFSQQPALIIGNGWSRAGIDIGRVVEVLSEKGSVPVTFACNQLCADLETDVQIFNDGEIAAKIANGTIKLKAAHLTFTADSNAFMWQHQPGAPFFFRYDGTIDAAEPPFARCIVPSSTGNAAYQLAVLFGCNPIYLLGFDYCFLPDSEGKPKGNVYKDIMAERDKHVDAATGLTTTIRLREWADDLLKLVDLAKHYDGRETYRIGNHGLLTQIPWIEGAWMEVK